MPIVAMTREMGSLGKDVAQGVSDALGVPLYYGWTIYEKR